MLDQAQIDQAQKLAAEHERILGMMPCMYCYRLSKCSEYGTIECYARIGATSCMSFFPAGDYEKREMLRSIETEKERIRKKWAKKRRLVRRRRAFAREIAQELAKALRGKGGAL